MLVVCCLALATALPSRCDVWTEPVDLMRMSEEADASSGVIAVDGTGRLHVIVNRSGQTMWHIVVENDVWTSFAFLAGGVQPAVATDNAGRAHAVWSEGWEIRYKRWSGGSWDVDSTMVSSGNGNCIRPDVFVDGSNNVHVVWVKDNNVWYNRRSGSTGTWIGPEQVTWTNDLETYLPPKVAAVGVAPVIIWGRDTGGENRSVWFTSAEGGS